MRDDFPTRQPLETHGTFLRYQARSGEMDISDGATDDDPCADGSESTADPRIAIGILNGSLRMVSHSIEVLLNWIVHGVDSHGMSRRSILLSGAADLFHDFCQTVVAQAGEAATTGSIGWSRRAEMADAQAGV